MKPMLAGRANLESLLYPMLASPKLDGIRCLIINGVVLARSLKKIPNRHVQSLFGRIEYNGFDGELIVGQVDGSQAFTETSSGVMSFDGEPDVKLWVFDDFSETGGFARRFHTVKRRVQSLTKKDPVQLVQHQLVRNLEELLLLEEAWVKQGFEGVMLRRPDGSYKHGRSTPREGGLLKLKRFDDGEAVVIGAKELMHNKNEAQLDELGHLTRSSHKSGKEGRGLLGAIEVMDLKSNVFFDIGTGFDHATRVDLWKKYDQDMQNGLGWLSNPAEQLVTHPGALLGRIVKYKFQAAGAKDKPRFPVFLGFRDKIDT